MLNNEVEHDTLLILSFICNYLHINTDSTKMATIDKNKQRNTTTTDEEDIVIEIEIW